MKRLAKLLGIVCLCGLVFCVSQAMGAEESGDELELDEPKVAGEGENASNPLAKVKNTDFRWQHLDLDGAEIMISSSMVRSWPTPQAGCQSADRLGTRRGGMGLD